MHSSPFPWLLQVLPKGMKSKRGSRLVIHSLSPVSTTTKEAPIYDEEKSGKKDKKKQRGLNKV